jgi:hypothetical protein
MKTINHLRHEGISDDNIVERIGLIPVAVSPGQTPEQVRAATKRWLDEQETKFDTVAADLIHYNLMRGSGSAYELAAALGGQIEGALQAPAELLIGASMRAGTSALRLLKASTSHAAIRGALDTFVHNLVYPGVQQEFDLDRRAKSAAAAMLNRASAGGNLPVAAPRESAVTTKPGVGQELAGTNAPESPQRQEITTSPAPFESIDPPSTANDKVDATEGQIPYKWGLSNAAVVYRRTNKDIGGGRNVAVFEVEIGEQRFRIARASKKNATHAERMVAEELTRLKIEPDQVTRIYSELQPCTLPRRRCQAYIARNFPNAYVTWSFEYGPTRESRERGKRALRRAVRNLDQDQLGL